MKYKTIVIDPPWDLPLCNPEYSIQGPTKTALPYKVMSDNALYNFNINKFADKECDLFLWTTKSKLHLSFHLLKAWGFKFNNLIAWNKNDGVCSNGFHNILEFVMYAYRGKSGVDFTNPLKTYFSAKRLKHSQKPDSFYAMLRTRTKEPRIDIFARKRHFGFDSWGDQVETELQIPLTVEV